MVLIPGLEDSLAENPLRLRADSPRPENILVVDDDDAVRELMAIVLESDGFNVLRARHSKEALLFNEEFPGTLHLLLTDFSMKPYQNGFELAQQVRASRPEIKVVYASGYVEHEILQDEIVSEASAFMAKPFSPSSLLECIHKSLGIAA